MFYLQFVDHSELEKSGRPYRCSVCEKIDHSGKKNQRISKIRRCHEDRWDFSEKDGGAFPVQIETGGPTFGFCPSKVRRDDPQTVMIFNMLTAILETGTWPRRGGLEEQEEFWIDLVAEFGPARRAMEFNERYSMVAKGVSHGLKSRTPGSGNPIGHGGGPKGTR